MTKRLIGAALLLGGICSASTITGSISPDLGGPVDLTALGTVDWAHYGRPGGGTGGANPFADDKSGGTVIGTPTSTRGIFKFYDFSLNTYSWTDGTPTAAGSMDHGMVINDGAIGGGFTEIFLPVAASTTPMRIVLYLGTDFFPGTDPDPIATLDATLGTSVFSIGNISGRNIVTLDFTGDGPSTLNISFNSLALRESGGPEILILDAAYVQPGQSTGPPDPEGVPEPSTAVMLAAGVIALIAKLRHTPR